jgi:hypothetical protein
VTPTIITSVTCCLRNTQVATDNQHVMSSRKQDRHVLHDAACRHSKRRPQRPRRSLTRPRLRSKSSKHHSKMMRSR